MTSRDKAVGKKARAKARCIGLIFRSAKALLTPTPLLLTPTNTAADSDRITDE
jgi:hypothetical protein